MELDVYTVVDALPNRLNAETVHYLMDFGKTRSFAEGDIVVKEGDKSESVYIILEGSVNVSKEDFFGNNNVIATASKGCIFGEMGVFLELKRSGTIMARSDLTVLELPNKGFLSSLTRFPDLTFRLLKSMSTKLNDINEKLVSMINEKLMIIIGAYFLEHLKTDQPRAVEELSYDLKKIMNDTKIERHNLITALLNYKRLSIVTKLEFLEHDNIKFKLNIPELKYYLKDISGIAGATDPGD